jgi:hypothetical protein
MLSIITVKILLEFRRSRARNRVLDSTHWVQAEEVRWQNRNGHRSRETLHHNDSMRRRVPEWLTYYIVGKTFGGDRFKGTSE